MSDTSDTELLLEASGVKITKTSFAPTKTIVLQFDDTNEPSTSNNKSSCGFHLTKTIWDAYPWVASVEYESIADRAGLRPGDCLLDIDGTDVLGLKMKDVAILINDRGDRDNVNLRIWRHKPNFSEDENTGKALRGPLPEVVIKLTNTLSETLRYLECPVCLENAAPPVSQCVNGHILCFKCRPKTLRCPICRVRLGQGRCLIAENIRKVILDIFDGNHEIERYTKSTNKNLIERLFGSLCKSNITKTNPKNINVNSKSRLSLLTKLFLGDVKKAASTENLATVSQKKHELLRLRSNNVYSDINSKRLTLNDRPKSASTSELTLKKFDCEMDNIHELQTNITVQSRTLNINLNSISDGLYSSVCNKQLSCPFYIRKNCEIVLTINKLVDHLIICHGSKIIHIRGGRIRLPIPSSYESTDVFLMHYMNNMFILQVENDLIWMIEILGSDMNLKWTLNAIGQNDTEMICNRQMTNLKYPMVLSSDNIVQLPEMLKIYAIDVKIMGNESELGICKT